MMYKCYPCVLNCHAIPTELNHILVALIPKKPKLDAITEYHCWSLGCYPSQLSCYSSQQVVSRLLSLLADIYGFLCSTCCSAGLVLDVYIYTLVHWMYIINLNTLPSFLSIFDPCTIPKFYMVSELQVEGTSSFGPSSDFLVWLVWSSIRPPLSFCLEFLLLPVCLRSSSYGDTSQWWSTQSSVCRSSLIAAD